MAPKAPAIMKITYFCLIFVLLIFASMGVNGQRFKRSPWSRESLESRSRESQSHSHERGYELRMGGNSGGAGPLPPQA